MLVPNPSTYYSGMHIRTCIHLRTCICTCLFGECYACECIVVDNIIQVLQCTCGTHTLTPKHTCPHLHTSTHVHTQTQTTLAHTSTQTTCAHEYAHPHAHTHVRMVENLLIIIAFFPIQQLMVAIGNTAANRFWEHHLQQEKLDAEVER